MTYDLFIIKKIDKFAKITFKLREQCNITISN